MFCSSCGVQQPSEAAFCPSCGKRQPASSGSEPLASSNLPSGSVGGPNSIGQEPQSIDFPSADLEPIGFFPIGKQDYRYKDRATAPPKWTEGSAELMCTETHMFIQSRDVQSMSEKIARAGNMVAGLAGGMLGAAVPIVGIAVGIAALAADKAIPRKSKHPGYGKNNQFRQDALLGMFLSGENMWAVKSLCEFRTLRSRVFMDTTHYMAILGRFHHVKGIIDLAVFLDFGNRNGADAKKSFEQGCGIACGRDDKFKVRSEAMRSLTDYPEPPITTELDERLSFFGG
jgi:hypothetical protein